MPDRIRRLERTDLGFAKTLVEAAGWNQTARDWEHFLERESDGAFLALEGDRPAGTVATIRYGAVAWVSMLLVAPEHRGRGIGRTLLERALDHLSEVPTVMLDATPAGRPIYAAHGFVAESEWTRMRRAHPAAAPSLAPPAAGSDRDARSLRLEDLPALLALDRDATGLERAELAIALRERRPDLALTISAGDRLLAACLARDGRTATHIGPVLAHDRASASRLFAAVVRRADERREPLIADATPGPTADAADRAALWRALGFRAERGLTRMRRGAPLDALEPGVAWAHAGPEFG